MTSRALVAYLALMFAFPLIVGLLDGVDTMAWMSLVLWLPFVTLLAAFYALAPSSHALARACLGGMVGLITVVGPWMLGLTWVAWGEETGLISGSASSTLALALTIGAGVWVVPAGLAIHRWSRHGCDRQRLLRMLTVPTVWCVVTAGGAGTALVLTPYSRARFLEGIVAIATMAGCAVVAAWLAGAWLISLRIPRADATDLAVPAARARRT